MESIISLIIIIALFATFSYFGLSSTTEQEDLQQASLSQTQEQESAPEEPLAKKQTVGSAAIAQPKQQAILIDTFITDGPEEGEIIKTNRVAFEFEAKIYSPELKGRIYFETKLLGFDEKWISSRSKERIINFIPGPKEYTFLVRAKVNNSIDLTPAKRTFKISISPYFGKVNIYSIQAETTSRPSLITLNTHLKKEEEINITGWQIRGKAGSFVIPQGTEKYHPGYNQVPKENIFVKQNDRIYLSGGSNPLGRGRNFRPNKCLGYLTEYRDFPISFPINCPKPTREEISHLNPCCQEFILRLRTCETPDYSSNLRISLDSECVSYLSKNFNYTGCFMDYSKDENFLGENWHIYMNSNILVSNDCDTLYLRDQNGLIIDQYSYGRAVCR